MGDRPGSPSGAEYFGVISDGKPGAVTNLDLPLVPGCLAWVKKRSQVTARSLRTVSVTSLWISRAMRPPAPSRWATPQPLDSLAMQQTMYLPCHRTASLEDRTRIREKLRNAVAWCQLSNGNRFLIARASAQVTSSAPPSLFPPPPPLSHNQFVFIVFVFCVVSVFFGCFRFSGFSVGRSEPKPV